MEKRAETYSVSYRERERKWMESEHRAKYEMELAKGFQVADIYLNQRYLDNYSEVPIIFPSSAICVPEKLRFYEVSKIVYDVKESTLDKITSVYNALYNLSSSVAIILDGNEYGISFYLGVRMDDNVTLAGEVLESTLKGNFPGICIHVLDASKKKQIINNIGYDVKSLTSLSMIPSIRNKKNETEQFIQGLEKFIDTMNGKKYTAIFLAIPIMKGTLEKKKHGYEELYSTLSPYSKLSLTYGQNEAVSVNEGISSSFSHSISESISNSNSRNNSQSSGTNRGYNNGSSYNYDGWGMSSGTSNGSFSSYTSGTSFSRSVSNTIGSSNTDTTTIGNSNTTGTNKSITMNHENKGVVSLMKKAELQLERIEHCETFGLWEFGCYFMSKDIATAILAVNSYKALMAGEKSNTESAHVNIWNINRKKDMDIIINYIKYLQHPVAEMEVGEGYEKQYVTPANVISGTELPLIMGFPKKSVSGLAVIDMAEFGRAVVYENKVPEKTIEFGNIYHMGIIEKSRVVMDLDLLASHCFITGSSGSGKSYATYELLEAAQKQEIKMLIIEPAKGEYKQVFGGLKGIKIFTTDSKTYRMLKINPFQFPDDIHILSHIEQLLQIFNASWPLYAAMPAILKEAVVQAYIHCGWDVQNSIWIPWISDRKYPIFEDVLKILPEIINHSEYSADSKGDYKGALVTRVQSMTAGLNGEIFKNSEGIQDGILFDSNCIIDLSDIGSEEKIAVIMGVLIMKLNEYRRAQRKTNQKEKERDQKLKHITVLEEAHNLLKRTSKEQNQEGANIVGKSVEMISNSIKEMRTYGEGFLIIDQSPMSVDSSVIENTATKIIMNTPAQDACKELGSALSLNEMQTKELSRLNVGVAAVFQKGWLMPVLMKVDCWDNRYEAALQKPEMDLMKILRGELVKELVSQILEENYSVLRMKQIVKTAEVNKDRKYELKEIIELFNDFIEYTNGKLSTKMLGTLFMKIVPCSNMFDVIPIQGVYSVNSMVEYLENKTNEQKEKFKNKLYQNCSSWINKVMQAFEYYFITSDEKTKRIVLKYLLYLKSDGGEDGKNPFSTIYILLDNGELI